MDYEDTKDWREALDEATREVDEALGEWPELDEWPALPDEWPEPDEWPSLPDEWPSPSEWPQEEPEVW